jgi:hypothetical protein
LQRKGEHNDYLFAEPHVGDFTVVGDAYLGLLTLEHEIELEHDLERTPQ